MHTIASIRREEILLTGLFAHFTRKIANKTCTKKKKLLNPYQMFAVGLGLNDQTIISYCWSKAASRRIVYEDILNIPIYFDLKIRMS